MTRRRDWVLRAYRLPREPSAPRLAVWGKLKRLGVAQLLDGLVGLPLGVILRGLSMVAESGQRLLELSGPIYDGLYEYERRATMLGRSPG